MHDLVVIDQRYIARIPGKIEDKVVGNLDHQLHIRIVKGRAITMGAGYAHASRPAILNAGSGG